MLYSVLIYGVEGVFDRLPAAEQEAILQKHRDLQANLKREGRMGPVAQLMATSAAVSIRQDGQSVVVMDGPFAETKEQLLGFYLIECDSIEAAIDAAKRLPLDTMSLEVRPVAWFSGGETGSGDR
jgi:hypothetical protein